MMELAAARARADEAKTAAAAATKAAIAADELHAEAGYLEHPRLGLLGAVRYWARGVVTTAVMMIVAMIKRLNIVDAVRDALPKTRAQRDAETNAMIVDLMEQGLAQRHVRRLPLLGFHLIRPAR